MANPLFQALGGNQNATNPIVKQIIGFKNQFQGDPQQKVQELLNSGKMTQEQCNSLMQQAQTILSQIGGMLPH